MGFASSSGISAFSRSPSERRRSAAQQQEQGGGDDGDQTKCVEVTKEVYRRKMIDEAIPAIRAAWPTGPRNRSFWALQDNAPSHNIYGDPEVVAAAAVSGVDGRLASACGAGQLLY